MTPEHGTRGGGRQWYAAPLVLGIVLIIFGILIIRYPIILQLLVAIPILMAGLGLALFGLDLWRADRVGQWRTVVDVKKWPGWPRSDD